MKSAYSRCAERGIRAGAALALAVIAVLGSLRAADAAGTFYYIDEKGVVQFVEDESMIPERYRSKKKTIDSVGEVTAEPKAAPEGGPRKPAAGKGDEKNALKDKFGNPPSYWRERYRALLNEKISREKELRSLESQREEVVRRYDSARGKAFFIGDSQSVTEAATQEIKMRELDNQIKIYQVQLDELNRKLSIDIQDEVYQAGGSPEWLLRDE